MHTPVLATYTGAFSLAPNFVCPEQVLFTMNSEVGMAVSRSRYWISKECQLLLNLYRIGYVCNSRLCTNLSATLLTEGNGSHYAIGYVAAGSAETHAGCHTIMNKSHQFNGVNSLASTALKMWHALLRGAAC